jgi:chromosome segregation ATPase
VEKVLADAFLDFYQKMLKPEFDTIHQKLAEHDERFSEVLGHLDSIYQRLGKLEEESKELEHRVEAVEERR